MRELVERPAELMIDSRGRQISSRIGTYNNGVTLQLVKKFKGRIVTVRDITRVQYGRLTDHAEEYVRRQISKAAMMLLKDGIPAFPVYEATGHHKVVGIKVLTEYSDEDMERLTAFKDAAEARGDLSYAKAKAIMEAMKALQEKKLSA